MKKYQGDFTVRKKRCLVLLLACVLFIMCLFSACSVPPNKNKEEPLSQTIDILDNSEVVIKDKIDRKEYVKKGSLGSATFKIDEAHTVTKEFLADGNSVTLELSNESGIKWTFMIPGDALLYPQTITMTALSDIHSSNFSDILTGGVRFEPDALQFLEPATLTVSGKNLTGQSLILVGNHDGSELDYAYLNQPADSTISAYIFHFSNAFTSDPEVKDIYEKASKDYKEAIVAAKTLMKEPLEISPPPSFDFRCKNNEAIASEPVDEYIGQVKNPEEEIIGRLLTTKRSLLILGEDEDNLNCDIYIQALVQRRLKKVNTLIKNYKYQPDKYLYVTAALLAIVKEGALLKFIGRDNEDAYLSTVGEWCNKTREYYLSELTKNHDYKAFSAALLLTKQVVLLNATDSAQAVRELSDAMSFEIRFESECKSTMDSYRLHGEIPVELDESKFILSGAGTGYYDDYKSYDTSETVKYTGPFTFKVNAIIDVFKPCEDSVDILIDRFGSLQESFVITDDDGDTYTDEYNNEVNWEDPTVHTEMVANFYDYCDSATGYYRFHLQLHNMSENAVDQTVSDNTAGIDEYGKIHFKLVHKPK